MSYLILYAKVLNAQYFIDSNGNMLIRWWTMIFWKLFCTYCIRFEDVGLSIVYLMDYRVLLLKCIYIYIGIVMDTWFNEGNDGSKPYVTWSPREYKPIGDIAWMIGKYLTWDVHRVAHCNKDKWADIPMDLPILHISELYRQGWHVSCVPTFPQSWGIGKGRNGIFNFIPCKRWAWLAWVVQIDDPIWPQWVHECFELTFLWDFEM